MTAKANSALTDNGGWYFCNPMTGGGEQIKTERGIFFVDKISTRYIKLTTKLTIPPKLPFIP